MAIVFDRVAVQQTLRAVLIHRTDLFYKLGADGMEYDTRLLADAVMSFLELKEDFFQEVYSLATDIVAAYIYYGPQTQIYSLGGLNVR